jgi:hypothetical protein
MTRQRAAQLCLVVVSVLLTAGIIAVPRASATTPAQLWAFDESRQSGTYATRGVVEAIDPHMMVIARPRGRGTLTFSMTPSTRRDGVIVVGSTVSVRYREESGNRIATAVALHQRVQ